MQYASQGEVRPNMFKADIIAKRFSRKLLVRRESKSCAGPAGDVSSTMGQGLLLRSGSKDVKKGQRSEAVS